MGETDREQHTSTHLVLPGVHPVSQFAITVAKNHLIVYIVVMDVRRRLARIEHICCLGLERPEHGSRAKNDGTHGNAAQLHEGCYDDILWADGIAALFMPCHRVSNEIILNRPSINLRALQGSVKPTSGNIHCRPVCMLRLRSCTNKTRYVLSRLRRSRIWYSVSWAGGWATYRFKPSSTAMRQACVVDEKVS
jgi:hypothetical protein